MTALAVPTLVVAGLFDPSVSVLPLTQKAMVLCPKCKGQGLQWNPTVTGNVVPCSCVEAETAPLVLFVSGPIHIAHQCPECRDGWICDAHNAPCSGPECSDHSRTGCARCEHSGLLYRSAQAEQVRQCVDPDGNWFDGNWFTASPDIWDASPENEKRFVLLVSGVSSETSPYLGDATAGWRP